MSGDPQTLNLHILLAEDNPVNQMVACKLLEKSGCSVVVVDNGLKALDAVAQESFDLILMDCMMPEMDGYEAASQIRASGQKYADIPIIAFTANDSSSDQQACKQAGMNDIIHKPVSVQSIQKLLTHWQQTIYPDSYPES